MIVVCKRRMPTKQRFFIIRSLLAFMAAVFPMTAFAGGVQTLAPVEVVDSAENLVGSADSSTEGTVTPKQLETRPLLRTGELLETVPGVIISQHSGEGKANQYYLRGFNLDHGTDLSTTVAGMPVNMPTHAHGQGYSDLSFLMPELVSGIQYRKGPYYAEEGDFSAAGAVHMDYKRTMEHKIVSLSGGNDGYERALMAGSSHLLQGDLLYALELFHNDGPWANPDDYRKINGLLRYSQGTAQNGFSVTASAYSGKWNSTDQVAERAVDDGLISRFGSLNTTDGGKSYRYSLSGDWQHTGESSVTKANVYLIDYGLDLWSDFTYFLNDPVHGDQFQQTDRRFIAGANVSQCWLSNILGHDMDNTVGFQFRNDNIPRVALYHTEARQILNTISQDHVAQTSFSLYFQDGFKWAEKFRTVAGVREDVYLWHVTSDNPLNSGNAHATMTSPKLSLIIGPWSNTEFYVNGGFGFHSNDGRGATINVDPSTGSPASKVSPLVRAKGAEIGTRTTIVPHLQSELTFWLLDLDSELVFTGDAGTTEPSYASRRYGVELANYYRPVPWFTLDADFAWAHSRYKNSPIGSYIPGSPEGIISAGATIDDINGYFGSLRVRYFGPRPLIEDNSVRSNSSTVVNARAGYKFHGGFVDKWRFYVDFLNIFNAKVSDVDYYYTSRLPGEPSQGVNDVHTHPEAPLEVRATLTMAF